MWRTQPLIHGLCKWHGSLDVTCNPMILSSQRNNRCQWSHMTWMVIDSECAELILKNNYAFPFLYHPSIIISRGLLKLSLKQDSNIVIYSKTSIERILFINIWSAVRFLGSRMQYWMTSCCKREVMRNRDHPLQWRHNGRDSVSNHQPHDCLLNRLFRRKSKNTSKLRVTGLCAGNSPGTGEFPAQMASYAENVSIWWRHHVNETGQLNTCLPLLSATYLLMA